jgi:glycine betaine/proline transport system substrate-binding protein
VVASYTGSLLEKIQKSGYGFRTDIFKGKIGWAVPNYIPKNKLKNISDLKKPTVRKKLNSKITGIEPSAGLMKSQTRL